MRKRVGVTIAVVCLFVGLAGGWYIGVSRGVPFVGTEPSDWAIGIYTGASPFELAAAKKARMLPAYGGPALTAQDVSDVPAQFVADPFMYREGSDWYMFFEVMNMQTDQGDIGLATSPDGLRWTYQQIVLDESFHLSYPYVFEWQGDYYMVPESYQANAVRLYKASDFPTRWTYVQTLIEEGFVDSSLFYFEGRWWMLTCSTPFTHDTLRLYYADELLGPWVEHPASPIVEGDANIARPGGRVLVLDGRVFRFAQDDEPVYGNRVLGFEITVLSPTEYEEKALDTPILSPAESGWNDKGVHNVDPHQVEPGRWIACIDGFGEKRVFGLAY
jgi:hypothetical protein